MNSAKFLKACKALCFYVVSTVLIWVISCSPPDVSIPDNPGLDFRDFALIEIQINDTETTIDDYVYTTAKPCRARIINHSAFASNIRVRLKNYNLTDYPGPDLQFTTALTPAFSDDALMDLPADGSWVSFRIIGDAANVSTRDKDVVMEIREDRSGTSARKNIVLGRKALMVTNSPPAVPAPQFEIRINNSTYLVDDYTTLSPLPCVIRLVNHGSFGTDFNVRLKNYNQSVGKLRFDLPASLNATPHGSVTGAHVLKTATSTTLDLTVPADGSAVPFYIAGAYVSTGANQGPIASVKDKDAVIELVDRGNAALYGRWSTMVRLRKNGNTLSKEERDRFLNALAILNESFNGYRTYINQHSQAANYNHSIRTGPMSSRAAPSFLPWHRAMLLRVEHDLQSIDPSVAIPYWKYNEPAKKIFHEDFMGRYNAGTNSTDMSLTNPLYTWSTGIGPDLRRRPGFNDTSSSPTAIPDIDHFIVAGTSLTTFSAFRPRGEGTTHGTAHNETGRFGGFIRDFYNSPTDPLFYMLHANVDRIWAMWQSRGAGRFDPDLTISYEPQGVFQLGTSAQHIGSYIMDQMWPWNEQSGDGGLDPEDMPTSTYRRFPIAPGNLLFVPAHPRVFDMIDYRVSRFGPGIAPGYNKGLGFDYDDDIYVFNPSL